MKTDLLQTYLSQDETDKQTVRKLIGEVLDKHPIVMGACILGIAITDDSIEVGALNYCPFPELHVSVKLPSWVLDTSRENIVNYVIEEYDRRVNPTNEYYKMSGAQL
jgi:hypothetical protein